MSNTTDDLKRGDWTAKEIQMLIDYYPTMRTTKLAAMLHRAPHCVKTRANKMGIRKANGVTFRKESTSTAKQQQETPRLSKLTAIRLTGLLKDFYNNFSKTEKNMKNWKRTTEAQLTLADNGYVLNMLDDELLLVYEGKKLPDDIGVELLSDLDDLIDKEEYSAFRIRVEVIPIPDVPFEKK